MEESSKPELETQTGLNYFRQVRDETELTGEQLLELYNTIKEIETHASYPRPKCRFYAEGCLWRKYAIAPFDTIPCHRALMIEVLGKGVGSRKRKRSRAQRNRAKAKKEKWELEEEAARKIRERIKSLRVVFESVKTLKSVISQVSLYR